MKVYVSLVMQIAISFLTSGIGIIGTIKELRGTMTTYNRIRNQMDVLRITLDTSQVYSEEEVGQHVCF